jgi:hypothetical protein
MKEFVKDKFHTSPFEQDPTGSHGTNRHSPMKEFVKDKFHTSPFEQDPTGSHGTNRHSPIRAL